MLSWSTDRVPAWSTAVVNDALIEILSIDLLSIHYPMRLCCISARTRESASRGGG